MVNFIKRIILTILDKMGYCLLAKKPAVISFPDMDKEFQDIYRKCKDYTLTGPQRMYTLYKAVQYIVENNIPGDFVECGVLKGGNPMLIAYTLKQMNDVKRKIYLYDTFEEECSKSKEKDVDVWGRPPSAFLHHLNKKDVQDLWGIPLSQVRENLSLTGYPLDKIVFVKGMVEKTLPGIMPEQIALLRLDTDWYESTYHELLHLFPRLSKHGVVIIDDYGFFQGAREATDQYFKENNVRIFLNRVDYSARLGIKV